jgi:hypothetical protein
MDIRARHITGTPEELDHVEELIEEARGTSLRQLDLDNAGDWARAERRDSLTLTALGAELKQCMDALEHGNDELCLDYFSVSWKYDASQPAWALEKREKIPVLTGATKLGDLRYRWIAVYPVTGASEGHYVHVDLLWEDGWTQGRIPLFLAKTFGGMQAAVQIAGMLARVLGV